MVNLTQIATLYAIRLDHNILNNPIQISIEKSRI